MPVAPKFFEPSLNCLDGAKQAKKSSIHFVFCCFLLTASQCLDRLKRVFIINRKIKISLKKYLSIFLFFHQQTFQSTQFKFQVSPRGVVTPVLKNNFLCFLFLQTQDFGVDCATSLPILECANTFPFRFSKIPFCPKKQRELCFS